MNRVRAYLSNRRRLDFVIAGAEKAGTTALFAYLRRVPGIYMPFIKEMHFFDRDDRYRPDDFARVHKWFLLAPRNALLGEATPTYFMNTGSFRRLHDYNPDIKVIAILRSPVRRAYSAWNYRRVRLRDKRDFMTAVRVEVETGADITIARENKYRYIGGGRYAEQIREARLVFPPENLMILKYEDFTRDQVATVREVVRFLGGPADVAIARVRRVNAWRYNRPLSKAEFDAILPLYEDDIAEVEALTGWDCSDWRRFEGSAASADAVDRLVKAPV